MRHSDGESFGIAAMDVLFNALLLFIALFGLQQIFTEIEKGKKDAVDGVQAGKMCVEIQWDYEQDVDMDLWVRGPDGKIIGYSNKNGPLLSLLRDDLGKHMDAGRTNMEMACSTSLEPGNYTFNVHYYSDRGAAQAVPVTMVVRFPTDGAPRSSYKKELTLTLPGQELTFMDFMLDKGEIVEGTMNSVGQELRSKKAAQ